jgi:hypothetical protein
MKIKIPKVTKFLPLQAYAPDEASLAGVGIQVWVDPPQGMLMEFDQLNREFRAVLEGMVSLQTPLPDSGLDTAGEHRLLDHRSNLGEMLLGWLKARARTKHAGGDHFKAATGSYRRSIAAWYARLWSQSPDAETRWTADELEQIAERNPQFYEWLCVSSWALIEAHRDEIKKGYRGPSGKSPAVDAPATPS